jgi:lysozyme
MALYGVDISSYQTRVDYTLWSFYMIKASEGRTLKDKMLDIHYNGVHAEDRLFGFYHYAHPENNDIVDEAKFFLDLVGRHAGHAVYALDWEGKALNYGPKTALRWLDYVYSVTKVRPLFYCSDSRTARYAEIAKHDYGLWVAKYSSRGPAHIGWPFCAMWQYSAKDMDYDVFFGTPFTWKQYAAQGAMTASTLPEHSAAPRDKWVVMIQKELNIQYHAGLAVDGIPGPKTLAWCPMLTRRSRGRITRLVQLRLGVTPDGFFGDQTLAAVKNFQGAKGLTVDGIVGRNTWWALLTQGRL